MSVSTFTANDYTFIDNKHGYNFTTMDGEDHIDLKERHMVGRGHLFGGKFTILNPSTDSEFLTIEQFQQKLGYPGIQETISTSKYNNFELNTPLEMVNPCEDCGIAKSRRLNLSPVTKSTSLVVGE